MNILLIGGNGFVGKELIKQDTNKSLNISYLSRNKIVDIDFKNIHWIQGDIFSIDNINYRRKIRCRNSFSWNDEK